VTQTKGVPLEGNQALEELTPRQIVNVMVRVQRLRHEKVDDLEVLTGQLAEAKKKATTTHGTEFLVYRDRDRAQEECTQRAKLAAAEAVFDVDATEGLIKACNKRLEVLKDDWDTCRSAGANERAVRNATEGIGS